MTVITVASASFCQAERVLEALSANLGHERVTDAQLFALAAERSLPNAGR